MIFSNSVFMNMKGERAVIIGKKYQSICESHSRDTQLILGDVNIRLPCISLPYSK